MTSTQSLQPNHESYLVHYADTPAVLSVGRELGILSVYASYFETCSVYILQLSRVLYLTPKNIESYATTLSPAADVRERVIHFGPTGEYLEKLIEVPIGEIDPLATIVVTVGLDKSHPNDPSVDSDAIVGISDGTIENPFYIRDVNDYSTSPPCFPAGLNDFRRVTPGTQVPATFKLTFFPFYKLGFCETAQEGGYINTGTFRFPLDITKPLFLTVRRHHLPEEYYFHYFKVEIYEG